MTSPEKIGRYEIVGELGRGAMGVVYKATDPNIGRMVALKTMRLDVHGVNEEEILRRFKHEAKLAGVMNHANIVTIYDAGEDQGVFYIAMEFMEGVTLQSILHEQRVVSAERMLEISRHMCTGLDYAHERGVIHRDIKPANIMITSNGVKIMDFGIAKAGGGMTSAGQVLGTPAYMSPEQVRGKTLDGRSDLFSYGVCLYEMVTGEKPFTGQNVTTIIYKIMSETPIPPRELDVTIHPGISAIVTKTLAKNPDERYQTGAELLKDLENYKSFGSDADTTRVIAASSTGAHATVVALAPTSASSGPTVKVDPVELKSAAVAASASGQRTKAVSKVAAKSGTVESIDSTVGMGRRSAKGRSALSADPKKLAIVLSMITILLGAGIVFHNKKSSTQETPVATQAVPTPSSSVPNQPTNTASAENTETTKAEAVKSETGETAEPPPVKKQPKPKPAAITPAIPATAANAAELGSMHIISTPAGAKVAIGSTSQEDWVTPFTAHKLAPGDYELTFTKAGFVTQKRHVKVMAGKSASMGVDLVEAGAKINVTSTPSGASILVDGKPTGKLTPSLLVVDSGAHQIMVRQQGYQEENTSVSLKDGESYNFAPTLEPKRPGGAQNPFRAIKRMFGSETIPEGKGIIDIKTNPPGALVMHNGKPWPKKTPLRGPMDPGTYQVTFRLEGYKPVRREFTIEVGKVAEVNVDLAPR